MRIQKIYRTLMIFIDIPIEREKDWPRSKKFRLHSTIQRSSFVLHSLHPDTGYLVQYLVLFVLFTGKSKYFSTFLQYKVNVLVLKKCTYVLILSTDYLSTCTTSTFCTWIIWNVVILMQTLISLLFMMSSCEIQLLFNFLLFRWNFVVCRHDFKWLYRYSCLNIQWKNNQITLNKILKSLLIKKKSSVH